MDKKILLFIPMYNCEKQITRVVDKVAQLGDKQHLFSEIIVVDNQSKDASCIAAEQALKSLKIKGKILQNRQNVSLGGSHKTAFDYAIQYGFDYVVVLHGDDQGNIQDLIPHIESGTIHKYDSMLGSRFMKGSKLVNYSGFRILGNHIFNFIVSVLSLRKMLDLGSGLNIYKTSYLKERFYLPFNNNLTFNVYLLFYGAYIKSKFTFFPITWSEDDQVSNARLFSQAKEILSVALRYRFCHKTLFGVQENEFSQMAYQYDVRFEHQG